MNRIKGSPAIAWLISLSLLVSMFCGTVLTGKAQAQSAGKSAWLDRDPKDDQYADAEIEALLRGSKISPDRKSVV